MKIAIVGTGYVGLVTGACLAEGRNSVWCVDKDEQKVHKLQSGILPIYEPGLEELVIKNGKAGRLYFTTDLQKSLEKAEIVFITVGTPPRPDGAADLAQVYDVARQIGQLIDHDIIVVDKSTVPVGTAEIVQRMIQHELDARGQNYLHFDVVSNPEFLKEGDAIKDFIHPDRVVIGADNAKAADMMRQLYQPFAGKQHPIIVIDVKSAEVTKYAANAMLASRISFINEIARLCDKAGADIVSVRYGIGTDSRIGMQFLSAGAGYGGSCFPKDVKELIQTGKRYGVEMEMAQAVDNVNQRQKCYLAEMIGRHFGKNIVRKKIAVWGLAFKPQTDDVREAPAAETIKALVQMGAVVAAYDPVANDQAREFLADCAEQVEYADNMMTALDDADALVLFTEWREFCQPDFSELKRRMRQHIIFDGRNQYEPKQMTELGFKYYCIGRGYYV